MLVVFSMRRTFVSKSSNLNMCIQCDIYGKEGNRADALFLNDAANFFRVFFFATSLLCAGKSQSSLFLFYFILQILNLYSFGAEKK